MSSFITPCALLLWLTASPAAPVAPPASLKPIPATPKVEVVELPLGVTKSQPGLMRPRLQFEFHESFDENAAPMYMKAALCLLNPQQLPKDYWEKVIRWLDLPVQQLPKDEVHQAIKKAAGALEQVEMAARRTRCEWALPLRQQRDVFAILLPEVQEMRSLGRLITLRARLAIAEGRFADALIDLRISYAMARHVTAQQLLVSGLVGITLADQANRVVEAWIQQGGSNLYWALTELPHPLVDLSPALEVEAAFGDLMFPELRAALARTDVPAATWERLLDEVTGRLGPMLVDAQDAKTGKPPFDRARLLAAAPGARNELVRLGHSPERVEKMSPAEAALRAAFGLLDETRSILFGWFHVPYWRAVADLKDIELRLQRQSAEASLSDRVLWSLPNMLLPAIPPCAQRQARLEQQTAALRCIEAVRLYVAQRNKLPDRLEDVRAVPLPTNPMTGKSFDYRREGEKAVLDLARGPGGEVVRQFRLSR